MIKKRITRIIIKTLRNIFIVGVTVVISFLITKNSITLSDGTALVIRDDFLLSFLGIFTGLAIAVITYVFSNTVKIKELIFSKDDLKQRDDLIESYNKILIELKQDTILIFLSLFFCLVLILLRDINGCWTIFQKGFISKQQFISCLQVATIFLTFLSIIDIIGTLFNLTKINIK